MDIFELRNEYTKRELDRKNLNDNPYKQFELWFSEAVECKVDEPNAMSLSTVNKNGEPNIRTVLLKSWDEKGFVFYTNYESSKALEIESNKNVCLLFFWPALERQVKIRGIAEKVSLSDSIKYFLSRPRGSQLGAWVSCQSKIITSRSMLEIKFNEMKEKFSHGEIPIPSFWGGYKVLANSFEFWQGRPCRLHDRFSYTKELNTTWKIERLSP